ncbi:MAG: SDR family NAD(P)-dependent oxidoreductase, partial [Burkholderiaceae bacterium]
MAMWKEEVALVTGGSSGIGRAAALAFAEEGALVVVCDVHTREGEETARMIRELEGDAEFIAADVSKSSEVENLIQKTVRRHGRLDFAFNNAGLEGVMASTADCTEDNWDRTLSINLKGVGLCMKYELQYMLGRETGAIVNCSSIAGLVGFQQLPAYVSSKHGMVGLTRTAA